ncbi:carbohydrate esterase family 1 protein [Stipitochalara longipes BDJ]|nr:carbohydrate esterase family 1 protein [Stipitochalara longipes BDJ]
MFRIQLILIFLTVACLHRTQAHPTSRSIFVPPLTGCGKALPHGQALGSTTNVSISSGGFQRSYLVFIPPTYNSFIPTPLILSYHGGVRTALDQLQLDQLTSPEFNTVSMVVYPQGINDTWQGVPAIGARNDVQFTADILNEIESLYCINPSRITSTGKSDGAGFCNVLACDSVLSKRIAAFAPVSGAYYINATTCSPFTVDIPCAASRTDIPFLTLHGGNDTTIAYLGGVRKNECLPAIPHFIQEWALRDGLGDKNVSTPLAINTTRYAFGSGIETGLVELIYESNIGHDWPSTKPNADNTVVGHHVANYNATPIILSFFEAHPLSILETLEEVL